MQIYSKTVPQLDAEHLSESLRRLETFLNYFQETTDHQLALLRRKAEDAEARAEMLSGTAESLAGQFAALRAEVNTLKTQVQALQAQGGTT